MALGMVGMLFFAACDGGEVVFGEAGVVGVLEHSGDLGGEWKVGAFVAGGGEGVADVFEHVFGGEVGLEVVFQDGGELHLGDAGIAGVGGDGGEEFPWGDALAFDHLEGFAEDGGLGGDDHIGGELEDGGLADFADVLDFFG